MWLFDTLEAPSQFDLGMRLHWCGTCDWDIIRAMSGCVEFGLGLRSRKCLLDWRISEGFGGRGNVR